MYVHMDSDSHLVKLALKYLNLLTQGEFHNL